MWVTPYPRIPCATFQKTKYCLGNLFEPELARVEEHLLWCHECIDRAKASDRFVAALGAGARRGGFDIELLAEEYRPKGGRQWTQRAASGGTLAALFVLVGGLARGAGRRLFGW